MLLDSIYRAIVEWPRCKEDSVLTIVEKLSNNLVKCSIFQSYDHLYSALETINNHRKRILELKSHDGGRDDREVSSINASNPSNTLFYKASTGRKVSMKLKRDAARPPLETETKKKSRTKGKKKGKGVAFATEIVESLNKENVNVVVNQVTPDTIIDKGNDEDFSNIFETDWL